MTAIPRKNHDDDGDEGSDARAGSTIATRNCAFP